VFTWNAAAAQQESGGQAILRHAQARAPPAAAAPRYLAQPVSSRRSHLLKNFCPDYPERRVASLRCGTFPLEAGRRTGSQVCSTTALKTALRGSMPAEPRTCKNKQSRLLVSVAALTHAISGTASSDRCRCGTCHPRERVRLTIMSAFPAMKSGYESRPYRR